MSKQRISKKDLYSNESECLDSCCSIRRLVCNLRDAVVSISAQTTLQQGTGPVTLSTERGNGFFIKGHYIICPASLVLPNFTFWIANARVPPFPATRSNSVGSTAISAISGVPTNSTYPNAIIRASKLLVAVSNVNGCGHSYSYEASIVGIDGAGNIAILRIDTRSLWNSFSNRCNPVISSDHPFLQWGKSRNTCSGDSVVLIGDITSRTQLGFTSTSDVLPAENAVTIGNIADNRYVFPGGQIPGELLLLSNLFTLGLQNGLPVIACDGKVIGMTILMNTAGVNVYNVALSEFFMRRPIKSLIRSFQEPCIHEQYQGFIEPVLDPIGDYHRFNKAWLGLGGILMIQDDFDTDLIATVIPSLTSITRVPGVSSNGPDCKEIVGFRILAIAGPTGVTGLFVPGGAVAFTLVPDLPPSPLFGVIVSGDIVTHLNGCPLGDRKGQISPSLVMWRVRPGDIITVTYRKQSENFNTPYEILVPTSSYQPFLDYPFYAGAIPNSLQSMMPTLI